VLRDNGEFGLVFREESERNGAHRNIWTKCEFTGSKVAIHVPAHAFDNTFDDCRIGDDSGQALMLLPGARRFAFRNCTFAGVVCNESGADAGHSGVA
jgi:hypothetical protein